MFRFKTSKPLDLLRVFSIIRTKALRTGLWFASLSFEERVLAGMIKSNIKIVKNVVLATVIARIIGKLFNALKNYSFLSRSDRIGTSMARAYGEIAYSMGNRDALSWGDDPKYIRYLGMMAQNTNGGHPGTGLLQVQVVRKV